tara:strand:+ start:1004 stop:1279 length:276 start_codon:yes stop_codon:yes gene_type:complete
MTITLNQTTNTLDPNGTAADPEQSLVGYIDEVTAALENAFPGVEVIHMNEDATRSFSVWWGDTSAEEDCNEASDEIQRITEAVYEAGYFWV